jgi:hypothetical protein
MFHGSDQRHIDQFLAGELSENMFLTKIEYEQKWPFSWQNWSPIVIFCKENRLYEPL